MFRNYAHLKTIWAIQFKQNARHYAIIYEEPEEVENLEVKKQILLKQIGAKIAYYRTLRDVSQSELAKKVCLSRSALSRIERGKYNDNVSVVILSDIAEALQIDLTLLVTFNEMEKQMWWNSLPSELKDDVDDESEDETIVAGIPAEHQSEN